MSGTTDRGLIIETSLAAFLCSRSMRDSVPRLEALPNEILLDVFAYLDALDLLQAFHKLNSRFDNLLGLLKQSPLTLHATRRNDDYSVLEPFAAFVGTLIIDERALVDLHPFVNLRRLKLVEPSREVLAQLLRQDLPYLEYLSISSTEVSFEVLTVRDRVFANGFSNLRSFHFMHPQGVHSVQTQHKVPSLRSLSVSYLRLKSYPTILSMFPQLHSLRFSMYSYDDMTEAASTYGHLKELDVGLGRDSWPWSELELSYVLKFVPNLERLSIRGKLLVIKTMRSWDEYDWCKAIITKRLRVLRKFRFHVVVENKMPIADPHIENIFLCMQSRFTDVYADQLDACLIIESTSLIE